MAHTAADDARDVVPGRASRYSLPKGVPGKFPNADFTDISARRLRRPLPGPRREGLSAAGGLHPRPVRLRLGPSFGGRPADCRSRWFNCRFNALMQTYVDERLTIIVLTNTDGAAHPIETKVAKILAP
jgi:hypothetical protein